MLVEMKSNFGLHHFGENFMSENTEPFWYRLIVSEKAQKKISTGLTIPYIIGAKAEKDKSYIVDEISIEMLLNEIKDSATEQAAFFQECPRIRQFVIGLTDRNNPEAEENSEIVFTNSNDEKSLYISGDAIDFGREIKEISENLNNLWLSDLIKERFSWDPSDTIFRPFSNEEKQRIESL